MQAKSGPHARLTSTSNYPAPYRGPNACQYALLVLAVPLKVCGVGVVSETPSVYGCGPDISPCTTPIRALTLKSKRPRSKLSALHRVPLLGKSKGRGHLDSILRCNAR